MSDAEPAIPSTLEWARRTNGTLTNQQRRATKAAIRRGYLDIAAGLARRAVRRSSPVAEAPVAPDSTLARLAEEAALEQGAALAGHGYRTWLIGSALSQVDGVRLDGELFFVAALLHDAGMVTEVVGQDFTVRSADVVLEVCKGATSVEDAVGQRLADAVVAHASPGLSVQVDPIAFYVQGGAMADLAGLRMWDLPRGYLRAAFRLHAANDVHRTVAGLVRREARDVPGGRFALLRAAGMDRLVQLSPTRRYA